MPQSAVTRLCSVFLLVVVPSTLVVSPFVRPSGEITVLCDIAAETTWVPSSRYTKPPGLKVKLSHNSMFFQVTPQPTLVPTNRPE